MEDALGVFRKCDLNNLKGVWKYLGIKKGDGIRVQMNHLIGYGLVN